MFTARGTDVWRDILAAGGGLKRVGEGEGDMCDESPLLGSCNPTPLRVSRFLPLVEDNPSSAIFPSPLRPGMTFVYSPVSASKLLPAGFGETALNADGLGFELAICSKWERREDTGFYGRLAYCHRHGCPYNRYEQ